MPEKSWRLDQEVELKDLDELLDLLLRLGSAHLIYRGQRKYDWSLVCSLSRALREQALAGGSFNHDLIESMVVADGFNRYVEEVETKLLRSFMEQARGLAQSELPPLADLLAWWELMQHHGAPTRLLDWTRSPFIALWFAFWCHNDCDGDAALYVFDTRNSRINHRQAAEGGAGGWESFLDDRQLQNRCAEDAIARDAIVPLVISPRVEVPRVVAQQSILTLVPNIGMPTYFNDLVFKKISTRVRLRPSWEKPVLEVCESMGINRFALFRDLDSIGDALREAVTKNLAFTAQDAAFHDFVRLSREDVSDTS